MLAALLTLMVQVCPGGGGLQRGPSCLLKRDERCYALADPSLPHNSDILQGRWREALRNALDPQLLHARADGVVLISCGFARLYLLGRLVAALIQLDDYVRRYSVIQKIVSFHHVEVLTLCTY